MFKLPAAYMCGVRVKEISETSCVTTVRHSWINQNPFKSMYFAVQAMAAELSTGALVMNALQQSPHKISMLVAQNKAVFKKKATGKISFACTEGGKIPLLLEKAIETGEGQTFWLKSTGLNQAGEVVAEFDFEWTIKLKPAKKV